jgi:uncharacterized SAM-binding protein YcdF (DUF218 family)
MFFYITKIFWFFLQPLNLALFLLVIGWALAMLGRRRLGGLASFFAVLILVLASWTSIGAMMLNPLEERFQRPTSLPEKIDGIVVLGGGLEGAINLVRGGYEMNSGGDRFVETAILARRFPDAKILISGGVGTVLLEGEGDADTAVRFLAAFGIPRERLIVENKSRNTAENAEFTRRLVDPKPGERWLLVTSAMHMPRSVGAFRKAGFAVEAWPVDWRTLPDQNLLRLSRNLLGGVGALNGVAHEIIGLTVYWATGRSSELFPGPLPEATDCCAKPRS